MNLDDCVSLNHNWLNACNVHHAVEQARAPNTHTHTHTHTHKYLLGACNICRALQLQAHSLTRQRAHTQSGPV